MKHSKNLVAKDYSNVFSWDIETRGLKWYLNNKKIEAFALIGKNIHSENEIITKKDYFEVNTEEFIKGIFDVDNERPKNWFKVKDKKLNKKTGKDEYKYYHVRQFISHNGAKFDNHFILQEFYKLIEKDKRFKVKKLLLTKTNEILMMNLSFKRNEKSTSRQIIFTDSYRRFPVALAGLGKAIGLKKLDFDSKKILSNGYMNNEEFSFIKYNNEYDILNEFKTKEDYINYSNGKGFEYHIRDVDILNNFLLKINDEMNLKDILNSYTIASISFNFWKKLIKDKYYDYANFSQYGDKFKKGEGKLFNQEKWRDIKNTYRGGLTIVNPKYQFKIIGKSKEIIDKVRDIRIKFNNYIIGIIFKYDVNSLYPSQMFLKLFPYGRIYKGDKIEAEYKIYEVLINNIKINKNYIPWIEKDKIKETYKALLNGEEEQIDMEYPKSLNNCIKWMDSNQFEFFQKSYSGEYKFDIRYSIKKGISPFTEYIKFCMNIKLEAEKEGNKAKRMFAKFLMNSLYGKFGQKNNFDEIKVSSKWDENFIQKDKTIWYINEEKEIKSIVRKVGDLYIYKHNVKEQSILNSKYLPLAVAITSYARNLLMEAIHLNFKNFVYADTDSIHLLDKAKGIKINPVNLGEWKEEGKVDLSIYRRPKHYLNYGIDEGEGKYNKLTGGGFNTKLFNNSTNEKEINSFMKLYFNVPTFIVKEGKTRTDMVNGGILITAIDYKFSLPNWYGEKEYAN